jgi:hypothetical protein
MRTILFCALLALPGLSSALGLNDPPLPLNVAAEGMGEAVVADGNFFNGTVYNPALLANAPYSGEFALGFSASKSVFGISNYLSDSANNLPTTFVGLGAGLNIALRFDDNWGFQIYNYTHGLFQVTVPGSEENTSGDEVLETVAMGTYSFNPLDDDETPLTVGVNLKVVDYQISSINSTEVPGDFSNLATQLQSNNRLDTLRWGADLGVLYDFPQANASLGLSAIDLLNGLLSGDSLNPAPVVVKFGASWHPTHTFVINADLDDLFSNSSYDQGQSFGYHVKLGLAYKLWNLLMIRGGYSNGNPSVGGGLPFLGVDYAYAVDDLTQVYTHNLQFKLQL